MGGKWCFSKVGFSAFIAMVVNCTAEMDRKSVIEVFVAAAFTAEQLQWVFSVSDMSLRPLVWSRTR